MDKISRRQVVRGPAAAAVTLGAPRQVPTEPASPSLRGASRSQGLDPIWTTAYITRNHGYLL